LTTCRRGPRFFRHPELQSQWVIITCALVWRGHGRGAGASSAPWAQDGQAACRHGFRAETTAALIFIRSVAGIPLSTTHAITTRSWAWASPKRAGALKWNVVERILWAWVFTLPVCGLMGYLTERLCGALGYH